MTRYDDYTVDELKTMLQRYFLYADLDDAAVDEMEAILAALRKKAPFPHTHSTAEKWAEFQAEHAEELASLGIRKDDDTEEVVEKKPETGASEVRGVQESKVRRHRSRSFLRVGLIAAAVVVLMVLITVTVGALGFNLWGWVPKWSDEDVRFVSEDTEKPYVEHIPDVLASMGITEPLYPTWLPDDFTRTESRVIEEPFLLYEKFQGNDRRLIITIYSADDFSAQVYQKEPDPPVEYFAGNTIHYILVNTSSIQAIWSTENYAVQIAGDISYEEMQEIIDSVYEGKK
jgi:hypothetical protein